MFQHLSANRQCHRFHFCQRLPTQHHYKDKKELNSSSNLELNNSHLPASDLMLHVTAPSPALVASTVMRFFLPKTIFSATFSTNLHFDASPTAWACNWKGEPSISLPAYLMETLERKYKIENQLQRTNFNLFNSLVWSTFNWNETNGILSILSFFNFGSYWLALWILNSNIDWSVTSCFSINLELCWQ